MRNETDVRPAASIRETHRVNGDNIVDSVVRVGVIGVGGMGAYHARTLAGLAGVDVVAVADPFVARAAALRDELGCRVHADPMELATVDDVDGLVIASPDETHATLAVAALERERFVLCEKPLATTLDDARRVIDAELATGRRLVQLGFMREFDPAHLGLLDALRDLGQVDVVRAVHRNANATPRPVEIIVGQSMVHDVHSVRFITGSEITAVQAFGAAPIGDSFRHVLAVCVLESGATAMLEFDDGGFGYEVSVEVLARDGDALTGPPARTVTRRNGSIDVHLGSDWFGWFADAYRIQDQSWIDSIRAVAATGPTTWDGFVAQAVVDAILVSLRSGERCEVVRAARPALYRAGQESAGA